MSQPDHGAIVNEIRSARIVASPELRARVLDLAAAVPPAPPRRGLPWRRMSLVLVPAAVALALTGALIAGLAGSGKKNRSGAPPERAAGTALSGVAHNAPGAPTLQAERQQNRADVLGRAGGAGGIPATAGRAQ